jgi:hypothetical protein
MRNCFVECIKKTAEFPGTNIAQYYNRIVQQKYENGIRRIQAAVSNLLDDA